MKPTYTPGPWQMIDDVDETVWVRANRENVICDIVGALWDKEANATQITREDIANARLIAAAPELLEVLQQLVELRGQVNYDSIIWNEARSIIAKAAS